MKSFPSLLIAAIAFTLLGSIAWADIQNPPMMDMGPTRKLSRGFANILWGWSELPQTLCIINETEGNSASWSYGFIKGFGRSLFRFGVGWYEVITFPAPCYKSSYRPAYINVSTPWKQFDFQEFPPELGWETRYTY